jgi:hypothetical protein
MEPTIVPVPRSWCLFSSRGRPWAVDLDAVVEVVEASSLVRVPMGPPQLVGLCAFRREVVPVVDPLAAADPDGRLGSTVLMLRTDRGPWGLRIDREGVAVAEAACAGDARSITRGETVHTILDPERAWHDVREAVQRVINR